MATIRSASTTIIVVKSEDLKFLVLRDNWLVTNRNVKLRLGNDPLGSYEGYVLQSNNQQEVDQLANNLSDTLSSKASVIKSIPSWTITQIVQGVLSAKVKN
jgi:hypothetical protein